ncbi:hypothetical protein PLEOSDRAFT_1100343 [Pleurotus ostreatus PC15]|uniref:DNA polymerase delta subunit 3 n=1 Tax=Pleurotus ostreatus (strain PC15) TaxID=1137138 RepID=A0A067P613_PLEO1|nr:hypothetical protein PLEOSDRAFT_1100343 [Pleurotus ostreatus PC15]
MSSQEIQDYITKQVSINKDIVTYRTLSRAFFINVNIAKNELVKFHASVEGETSSATYLLSGDLKPSLSYDDEDTMDVDDHGLSYNQVADTEEDSEEPIRTAIMLVSERDLEDQTLLFTHIHAQTIQCLSPSPVNDGNVLSPLTDNIRKVDNTQKGIDHAKTLGKVMTKGNKVKVPKPLAKLPAVPKLGFRAPAKTDIEEPKAKGKEKAREKQTVVKTEKGAEKVKVAPKATGKLDFSKAKTKEMKEKEREEKRSDVVKTKAKTAAAKETKSHALKEKEKPQVMFFGAAASTSKASVDADGTKAKKEVKEEPKRGIKRKSPARAEPDRSTSDDEQAPRTRVVKGAILSDDDDDDIPPRSVLNARRKSRASSAASATSVPDSEVPSETEGDAGNSEAERALWAIMDIDDDKVDRAHREALKQEEEEEEEAPFDDDVAMSDSDVPKPKPRARKTKKVIPVGSNGLKKKRVMKTEKFVDDKGYMITREVSDYESVDEAEAPPVKVKKESKSKAKAKDKHDSDDSNNVDEDDDDAKVRSDSKGKTKPEGSKPALEDVKREDGVVSKKEAPTVKKAPSRKGLKASGGSKGKTQQKSLMTFFGPPK